jgi:hypothetical protein
VQFLSVPFLACLEQGRCLDFAGTANRMAVPSGLQEPDGVQL